MVGLTRVRGCHRFSSPSPFRFLFLSLFVVAASSLAFFSFLFLSLVDTADAPKLNLVQTRRFYAFLLFQNHKDSILREGGLAAVTRGGIAKSIAFHSSRCWPPIHPHSNEVGPPKNFDHRSSDLLERRVFPNVQQHRGGPLRPSVSGSCRLQRGFSHWLIAPPNTKQLRPPPHTPHTPDPHHAIALRLRWRWCGGARW